MFGIRKEMNYGQLPKVSLRGGFSDRMGIHRINTEIQMNTLDERSRTALVNVIKSVYTTLFRDDFEHVQRQKFFTSILADVYLQIVEYREGFRYDEDKIMQLITQTILEDDYDAALTVVEYIFRFYKKYAREHYVRIDAEALLNDVFRKEYVGYRMINGVIVPISDETEAKEISDALDTPYENVHKHLDKALQFIANRDTPDYENSIKESISAVEAMCSLILGKSGTLGATLKKLEKENSIVIHPALNEAFNKLYGYTNDSKSGIRHASEIGSAGSTFEEARYMLVTCSAFINYLKGCWAGSIKK